MRRSAIHSDHPTRGLKLSSHTRVKDRAEVLAQSVGYRFANVPPRTGVPFPVISYSHGLPAGRKISSQRAKELASHCYLVITIDHIDCWPPNFPMAVTFSAVTQAT
jgi:hypothetical protein